MLSEHSEKETVVWKKKYKEFYQFRLILPIKIYYIPDFENIWSRELKVMAKKDYFVPVMFWFREKNYTNQPPKIGKNNRVLLIKLFL